MASRLPLLSSGWSLDLGASTLALVADPMNSFSKAGETGGREPGPPGCTFDLRITHSGSGVLVQLAGELDAETSDRFLDALSDTLTGLQGEEVELDLDRLTFLDVAGVRSLIRFHDQVLGAGGRVRVQGLDDRRLPVARMVGLRRYLEDRSDGGYGGG